MAENILTVKNRAELSQGISGGEEFFEFAVRAVRSHLRAEVSLLDLGCGTGNFGKFLGSRFGIRATGVDVVRHEGFQSAGYGDFQVLDLNRLEDAAFPGGWDMVFAIGLIEYLTDPRAFLRAAARLVRPGGWLVITSPNPASARSLFSLLRRGEYSAFQESTNPASITPVLAVDAARMFREAGLGGVEVDYSHQGSVPGLGGLAWQRFFPGLRGRLFSDGFSVVGRPGVAPD